MLIALLYDILVLKEYNICSWLVIHGMWCLILKMYEILLHSMAFDMGQQFDFEAFLNCW